MAAGMESTAPWISTEAMTYFIQPFPDNSAPSLALEPRLNACFEPEAFVRITVVALVYCVEHVIEFQEPFSRILFYGEGLYYPEVEDGVRINPLGHDVLRFAELDAFVPGCSFQPGFQAPKRVSQRCFELCPRRVGEVIPGVSIPGLLKDGIHLDAQTRLPAIFQGELHPYRSAEGMLIGR